MRGYVTLTSIGYVLKTDRVCMDGESFCEFQNTSDMFEGTSDSDAEVMCPACQYILTRGEGENAGEDEVEASRKAKIPDC